MKRFNANIVNNITLHPLTYNPANMCTPISTWPVASTIKGLHSEGAAWCLT